MRLLIADKFPEAYVADFRALGLTVDYHPDATADELPRLAVDAQLLVVRSTKVTRAAIEGAAGLELIIRAGAGYDTIDVAAASERGIYVANCPGKNSIAVAELAMGLMLAIDRRIVQNTTDLRAGKWNKKEYSKADGLKGKTLGIVGIGAIGRAVAQRAIAFEMDVVAYNVPFSPEEAEALGVGYCATLFDLAARSDVVSVHLPQTPETKKLFNADFFARLKKGAIFINTARGGLHDQEALERAVRERGVRAGLDVYDPEPAGGTADFTSPLFALDGFAGTHHIGASTEQAQNAIAEEAVRICREFLQRGQVPGAVNIDKPSAEEVQLVVRHFNKVGVLAAVLGIIRKFGVNIEEMSNTQFGGGKAAVAVLRLSAAPSAEMLAEIAGLEGQVIQCAAKSG